MDHDLHALLVDGLKLAPEECAGKVVVVTGAGRGIGRAVARAFACLGARVVVAEISPDGEQVVDEICRAGGSALFVQADVSDSTSVRSLAEITRRSFGPADILVNNAIRIAVAPLVEMEDELWDSILAVNLRGVFLTCKAFLPEMLQRGSGTIINMVSTEAMPGLSAYIASKQGVSGLSQSLALEVGSAGVHVIPFGPGMVDTPGIRSVAGDLAPRLGLTHDQFLGMSLHAAYDGLMPAEHAAAGTVYLALRLAEEFHGQPVNGYEVLERAGFLQVSDAALPQTAAPEPASTGQQGAADVPRLSRAVIEIIAETAAEFEKLPIFVRPMARAGFKKKSGASLDDWRRSLERLSEQAETGALPASTAASFARRLESLVDYYQGVPAETGRFTRDQALLAEISALCSRRIAAIRQLAAALQD